MAKRITLAIGLLAAAGLTTLVVNFDAVHWWAARRTNAPDAYAWHIEHACPHAQEAQQRRHDAVWELALAEKEPDWSSTYLREFPDGPHAGAARDRIDDARWLRFSAAEIFDSYLAEFPQGRHAQEARRGHARVAWDNVRGSRDERLIGDFITAAPEGPFAEEARTFLDDLRYEQAGAPTDQGLEHLLAYVDAKPPGRHLAQALERLEPALFERIQARIAAEPIPGVTPDPFETRFTEEDGAQTGRTTHYLLAYRSRFPAGAHAQEVSALLAERLWSHALRTEKLEDYELCARWVPEGAHAAAARAVLEGQDLETLRTRGEVGVVVAGAGITNVELELTWLHPDDLAGADPALVSDGVTLRIPAGTYFPAGSESTQSMLSYETLRVRLHHAEPSTSVSPSTACANKYLAIPGHGEEMSVGTAAPTPELTRIARAIDEAKAPYPVAQAAIWIVSDDARVEGLSGLVRQDQYGGHVEQVISIADMARALELCSRAGIEIEKRAIWKDRLELREHASPEFRPRLGTCETLVEAAEYGTPEEFARLLEGAKEPGMDVIYPALQRSEEAFTRTLAAHSKHLDELLAISLTLGNGERAPLLLELGANAGAVDESGNSVLGVAVSAGRTEVVKLLLARGAKPDVGTRARSPLQLAAENGNLEIAQALLASGADPERRPQGTPTVKELCRERLKTIEEYPEHAAEDLERARTLLALFEK